MLKNKDGFTLLEAVAGMLITALVLVGMLKLFGISGGITVTNKHKLQALRIIQARMDQIKSVGYDYLNVGDFPQYTNVIIDEGETSSANDDVTGLMTTTVTSVTDGKKIIASVSWTDVYGTITEFIESVIYDPN